MDRQPDDIIRYIRLTENAALSVEDDSIFEGIVVPDIDTSTYLIEDVNDMIFKLRSYSEQDSNLDYARGVEEGLALAANMLDRLIERYSGFPKE